VTWKTTGQVTWKRQPFQAQPQRRQQACRGECSGGCGVGTWDPQATFWSGSTQAVYSCNVHMQSAHAQVAREPPQPPSRAHLGLLHPLVGKLAEDGAHHGAPHANACVGHPVVELQQVHGCVLRKLTNTCMQAGSPMCPAHSLVRRGLLLHEPCMACLIPACNRGRKAARGQCSTALQHAGSTALCPASAGRLTPREPLWLTPREPLWLTPREPRWLTPREPLWLTPREPLWLTPREPLWLTPHEPLWNRAKAAWSVMVAPLTCERHRQKNKCLCNGPCSVLRLFCHLTVPCLHAKSNFLLHLEAQTCCAQWRCNRRRSHKPICGAPEDPHRELQYQSLPPISHCDTKGCSLSASAQHSQGSDDTHMRARSNANKPSWAGTSPLRWGRGAPRARTAIVSASLLLPCKRKFMETSPSSFSAANLRPQHFWCGCLLLKSGSWSTRLSTSGLALSQYTGTAAHAWCTCASLWPGLLQQRTPNQTAHCPRIKRSHACLGAGSLLSPHCLKGAGLRHWKIHLYKPDSRPPMAWACPGDKLILDLIFSFTNQTAGPLWHEHVLVTSPFST